MAQLSFLTYLRGIYKLNLAKSGKVHNAIIQSIYDCFVMAKDDIDVMRLEMCLSTATGYWLDTWGDYFSVYRKSGETDEHYSKRIIDTVIQPKSTIPAIKDSIVDHLNSTYQKNYTRQDISIKEPWKDIAKYSHKGELSNTARFFSGNYYSHATIDISVPEEITDELIDLVNSVKAAGVKVLWSVLNSYDIVSGFNSADDAWASYHRHIQTQTKRSKSFGFMLSTSSAGLSGSDPIQIVIDNLSEFTTEAKQLVFSGERGKDWDILDGELRVNVRKTTQRYNSARHFLSGGREVWFLTTSLYQWYAKVTDKQTDDSIIITKKDLIGLLGYYTEIETEINRLMEKSLDVSNHGSMSTNKQLSGEDIHYEYVEHLIKITDEMFDSLKIMDEFLSLSYHGRMSTSSGVMFKHTAEHDLYVKLLKELKAFKEKNEYYYNSVQPPILNGERAMWLVQRNKNWLWNTPTMTHRDFFELWEPFDDYEEYKNIVLIGDEEYDVLDPSIFVTSDEASDVITSTGTDRTEHTLQSIEEFEDAYYKGYITFGDKYQPPVVTGRKIYGTPRILKDWLFDSPVYCNDELEEIYRRQFAYVDTIMKADYPEPTMADIMRLEERFNYEGYSVARETQPAIEVVSTKVTAGT